MEKTKDERQRKNVLNTQKTERKEEEKFIDSSSWCGTLIFLLVDREESWITMTLMKLTMGYLTTTTTRIKAYTICDECMWEIGIHNSFNNTAAAAAATPPMLASTSSSSSHHQHQYTSIHVPTVITTIITALLFRLHCNLFVFFAYFFSLSHSVGLINYLKHS